MQVKHTLEYIDHTMQPIDGTKTGQCLACMHALTLNTIKDSRAELIKQVFRLVFRLVRCIVR